MAAAPAPDSPEYVSLYGHTNPLHATAPIPDQAGHVTFPDDYRRIEAVWFREKKELVSVDIPDTINIIEIAAFFGCTNLKRVTIKDVSIPMACFKDCSSLETVVITGEIAIGSEAFAFCEKLTSITFSGSVSDIHPKAFYGCVALKEITLPETLTVIQNSTFQFCKALTNVHFPPNLKRIEDNAFEGCTSLAHVDLPQSLQFIGDRSFYQCLSLTTVTIPSNCETIGAEAFSKCEWLTSVVCLNPNCTIWHSAFNNCRHLSFVILPDAIVNAIQNSDNDALFFQGSSLIIADKKTSVVKMSEKAFKTAFEYRFFTHRSKNLLKIEKKAALAQIYMIADRIDFEWKNNENAVMPSLPFDMWELILKMIQVWELNSE